MGKKRQEWKAYVLALLFLICSALPFLWYAMAGARHHRAAAAQAIAAQEPRLLALTFDDGPRRQTTSALLDGLSQRGVHATFFLIGLNVAGNEDLVLRMEEEGHQVGIHSYSHKVLTGLSGADFYAEVGALRTLLEDILGHDSLLLRPPYGMVDAGVSQMAGCPIIQWSIDPEDWSDEDTTRQVELIVSQAGDGDIILLHDIYSSSVDTALQVVDRLLAEGFYFVTVDELFAARGIELEDGQVYMHARG